MHDFRYVTKKQAQPIKDELYQILYMVQDLVRDNFTFSFTPIGSSSRNMITCDAKSNIGFDFDINIEVNDDNEDFEPKEIRTIIRTAIDRVAPRYGYKNCEDSTRVLTIKKVDTSHSRRCRLFFADFIEQVFFSLFCFCKTVNEFCSVMRLAELIDVIYTDSVLLQTILLVFCFCNWHITSPLNI